MPWRIWVKFTGIQKVIVTSPLDIITVLPLPKQFPLSGVFCTYTSPKAASEINQ